MKKILQVFPTLTVGGLETFVINIYRSIDISKYQFDFLVNRPEGGYKKEIEKRGGKIFVVPQAVKGWFRYTKALDNFFKEHAQDYCAIHLHASSLSNIATLYYAKIYGIPVRIIHSHNSTVGQTGLSKLIHLMVHYASKPFICQVATHYYGCSDKALDWMYNGTHARKECQLIKNGIDTKLFSFNQKTRVEVRQELGIENSFVIGHVGRMARAKNQSFLLQIFKAILNNRDDARLVLVGDGPDKDDIVRLARSIGVINNVIFTGLRSDVNRLLQAFDIIIMPSLYEGLPVCLVEAQTAALPLLLSDTISRQSKILECVKFKSLQDTPEEWATDAIELAKNSIRRDTTSIITENGFDINETANRLTHVYTSAKE